MRMQDQVTDERLSLDAAIGHAVEVGKQQAADLERRLAQAFGQVERAQADLRSYADQDGITEEARTVAEDFLRTTDELRADAGALLHRQRDTLDTFNIAFFGRTGAGKSSL